MVWMPKELKEFLADKLKKRGEEMGIPNFIDMIGDETICEDTEKLVEHLTAVGHPAMAMAEMF